MFDLDYLEDSEVKTLISSTKTLLGVNAIQELHSRVAILLGKIDFTSTVEDGKHKLKYKIKVYRGKRDTERYSFHIRFEDVHHHLVRIDIGSTHNEIKEDHIHIYNKDCEPRANNVLPISKSDFPSPKDIIDALDKFLEYNSIK